MAAPTNVVPLFVDDMKSLLECLRLVGADSDETSALPAVRLSVRFARTEMYRRLSSTIVNTLVAITPEANPTTDNGMLRAQAEELEVSLVRWKLMQDLPVLFMGASTGTALEKWNEEGLTREVDDSLPKALDRLLARIEDLFSILDNDSTTDPGARSELFSSTRECTEMQGSVFIEPHNRWLRPSTTKASQTGGLIDGSNS